MNDDKVKDAWLEYMSANQYKAEYFLNKYLKTLDQKQLKELLDNFKVGYSNLIRTKEYYARKRTVNKFYE
jgi:arsenate reductase-like glutaredoxin family protein